MMRDPIARKQAVMAETEQYVAFGSECRAMASLPGSTLPASGNPNLQLFISGTIDMQTFDLAARGSCELDQTVHSLQGTINQTAWEIIPKGHIPLP